MNATDVRAASQRLAKWLNSPDAKGHPAVRLVEAATQLSSSLEHYRERFDSDDLDKYKSEIDRIARRFPGVGEVLGAGIKRRSFLFGFRSLRESRRAIHGWGVVNDVRILAEAGALWRIRRCALPPCGRVFAANFPHQIFCSGGKCKQKYKRSSPEYKEQQKKKAAENYRNSLPPWARKKLDEKRARRHPTC